MAAFNTSDVDTLVDLHTDDAVVLKPGKPPEIGRQVMRTSLERGFSMFRVKESRTIEELEIVGDWAFTLGLLLGYAHSHGRLPSHQ